MFKRIFLFIFFFSVLAYGEDALNNYVRIGLANNLALQQKEFSLKRSMAALTEARGMFLPSVSIEARYTRAGGGRIIDFPVGDLMNPVYESLNYLLKAPLFPTNLPNERIPFLREEEHDTKIRLIQPLFQPGIVYNYKIHSDLKKTESLSRDLYARHLVADIKTAYYQYLQAVQIVSLLDETHELLEENVRVSQSLFNHDKVTQDVVFRAEAELFEFEQQQAEAKKGLKLAASYFNFLLNRPFTTEIETIEENHPGIGAPQHLEADQERAVQIREEIRQLEYVVSIHKNTRRASQTTFLPGVTAVVDYGYQGEAYQFGPEDDYWMASLVGSWNLFNGFQDKARIDQARYAEKEAESQIEAVRQQIRLQVTEAYHNVQVALESIEAADAQKKSARKSFSIIEKQYAQGMAPQIAFIDARSTKTGAEVNAIVTLYDYWIKLAEWEKITAGYNIKHQTQE